MNNQNSGNWGRIQNHRGRGNRGFGRGGNRSGWRGGYFNRGSYGGQGGYRDDRNFGHGNNWNSSQQWKRPKRDTPGKRLTEDAIGVTKYISDHEGFNGIIKSRYSDFQVSEINDKDEIAKLTDFTPPEPPADDTVDEDEDLLLSKYNLEILPLETWDSINKLVLVKETTENIEIDASEMSKEQRTKIHDAVKKAFGDSIVGSTVNMNDKKLLRFEKYRKGVRIDNRVKWIWPGEYLHFIVHKENCDTMEAASRIAERMRLNLKPSMIGYAGTKDRRAVTSQWFSLRKVDPRRVAGFCRGLRDVHVGNFSFSQQNLKLGMLKGNKFRIALRNVTADEAYVDAACRLLQEGGFLNYYGLQRFGTRIETPTYEIGLKLLQGNFREAIKGILSEREGPLQMALQRYHEAGPVAALPALPRGHAGAAHVEARLLRALAKAPNDLLGALGKCAGAAHVEARLLRALAKAPNDLLVALGKLARNTRLLYLHSYQSLIWNRAVTERVSRFGLTPAVGDLVPAGNEPETVTEDMNDGSFDEEDAENESDLDAESDKPEPTDEATSDMKEKYKSAEERPKVPVKVLTKDDIESGQYTIFDVILPLPGYNIEYPPNMKEFFEEQMTKDDLKLELRHKIKSYSMSGAYRRLVVRPWDMTWAHARYTQPHADLIRSDLDELHGKELTGIETDGKFKALLLTMSLPASCYATMALRELLKVDTSCDNQALQNNYHKRKNSAEKPTNEAEKPTDGDEKPTTEDVISEKQEVKLEGETENGVKRKLEEEDESNGKKLKTEDE